MTTPKMFSYKSFMHPRNIYKKKSVLKGALRIPTLARHFTLDLSGRLMFNYRDQQAIIDLNTWLLQTDFSLKITIPPDTLVPTVPLRCNYILWLEDNLMQLAKDRKLSGIDIGTGASCIYPLIIARNHGWKMLATEIKKSSIEVANCNIRENNFEEIITVKEVEDPLKILVGVIDENEVYDFCMCNPPFFASEKELNVQLKSRTNRRPPPNNASTGLQNEVITPGGEIEFVKQMIKDSIQLKDKIKVYSTMLGHKSSVTQLIKELQSAKPLSIAKAQFCQGRTVRWGLAWSFCIAELKSFTPLEMRCSTTHHAITADMSSKYNFEACSEPIEELLDGLQIKHSLLGQIDTAYTWVIEAYEPLWRNQRKKRRKEKLAKAKNGELPSIIVHKNTTIGEMPPLGTSFLESAKSVGDPHSLPQRTDSISATPPPVSVTESTTLPLSNVPSTAEYSEVSNIGQVNSTNTSINDNSSTDTSTNNNNVQSQNGKSSGTNKRPCDVIDDDNLESHKEPKIIVIEGEAESRTNPTKFIVKSKLSVLGQTGSPKIKLQISTLEGDKPYSNEILQYLKNSL